MNENLDESIYKAQRFKSRIVDICTDFENEFDAKAIIIALSEAYASFCFSINIPEDVMLDCLRDLYKKYKSNNIGI